MGRGHRVDTVLVVPVPMSVTDKKDITRVLAAGIQVSDLAETEGRISSPQAFPSNNKGVPCSPWPASQTDSSFRMLGNSYDDPLPLSFRMLGNSYDGPLYDDPLPLIQALLHLFALRLPQAREVTRKVTMLRNVLVSWLKFTSLPGVMSTETLPVFDWTCLSSVA